jgi:hypothetical protein
MLGQEKYIAIDSLLTVTAISPKKPNNNNNNKTNDNKPSIHFALMAPSLRLMYFGND